MSARYAALFTQRVRTEGLVGTPTCACLHERGNGRTDGTRAVSMAPIVAGAGAHRANPTLADHIGFCVAKVQNDD